MDTLTTSDMPTNSTTDTPESPQRRLQVVARRLAATREEVAAGIRLRHPEYDHDQVRWALFRAYLRDDELFHVVWPDAPLLDP